MEITFNESFASNLTQALHQPVIGLPLDLQLGDLHRFENAQAPFWTLKAQYDQDATSTDYFSDSIQKIKEVQAAIAAGDPLRVWWSETPDDLSGFYWLCDQLKGHLNQLSQVKVPMTAPKIGETLGFREWANLGEIGVDEIPQYLPTTKDVSLADRQVYEYVWANQDWSPIRIVGETLGQYPIGVPDWWYLYRLDQLSR